MRRCLRNQTSKEYFKEGEWTRNPEEASNFADAVEAAAACARYGLSNVELALRFSSAANDVFCTPLR